MKKSAAFTLIELMIVIAIITIVASIALPTVMEARKAGNEAHAVGSLKSIASAQGLFRESDKEEDGNIDYGSLSELGLAGVLDDVLANGTKAGYRFNVEPAQGTGTTDPRFREYSAALWWGVANPRKIDVTGNRAFATNQSGLIYYTQQEYVDFAPGTDIYRYATLPTEMYPIK